MPFTLQVEFTGLCLYLVHADGKEVAVLQPDCRPDPLNLPDHMVHADDTIGISHVGYIRFDLTNIIAAIDGSPIKIPPGTSDDGPKYELIHRFDRQQLDFGIDASEDSIGTTRLELPRFERIANEPDPVAKEPEPGAEEPEPAPSAKPPIPLLEPVPKLFSTNPALVPRELLMRTILRGGELTAAGKENWQFPLYFSRGDPIRYKDDFRSIAKWTREFPEGDGLTVTISSFDGTTDAVKIPLKAVNGLVSLKIANLCSVNPLEWEPLDRRSVTGDDEDFKWLYRLLQPTRCRTYKDLLLDCTLPIPMRPSNGGAGREDCFGGVLKVSNFT